MQPNKLLKDYRITNQRADAPDTTCWKDIFDQKIRGETANDLYVEQVEKENLEQLQDAQAERIMKYMDKYDADSQHSSSISGLSNLEDDEKEMIAQLKAERKEMYEEQLKKQHFGHLFEINNSTYCETVQQNDHTVIIHIRSSHLPTCKKIDVFMNQLAEKYPTVKFCQIDYLQAAKNYPESKCPTLLVYQNGHIQKQLQGIHMLGGMSGTLEDLELILQDTGVIIADVRDNKKHIHNYFKMDV